MSYFLDPVSINCGHNFCRPCLSLCWQASADHDHRSEEQICATHQEAKGLFCEGDQTLFRGPCSERPGHAAHSHSPIHTAAEESREKLLERMGSLQKMREETRIILKPGS